MSGERFWKHPALPFVECRYSENSERHYKIHMHKTFTVGAIEEGEVTYQVEGRTAELRPGSLSLINPETLHSCNPPELSRRSYYVLHLDVEWCLQVQQSLWQVETFSPADTLLLDDDPAYRLFVATMKALMSEGDPLEKEQMLADCMERIFLLVCKPGAEKNDPLPQIDRIKLQLGRNLGTDITMGHIALKLKANPYTLLRQFKAAAGITPHAYRTNCRIELARKLLQKGYGLSRVALECGFFDQSHFNRQFKAITAVTPGEYQVSIRR